MRKTALFLAVLFSAVTPFAVLLSPAAEPKAVMVFDAPQTQKQADPVLTEVPAEAIEAIEACGTETQDCFDPQAQEALIEFVFGKNEDQTEPVVVEDETEIIALNGTAQDEADVIAADVEDLQLLASAFIDSSSPLLQKPSGTLATGPFAPSKITLTDEERDYVERVVYSEVSGYSRIDALAVAQCIYDRCVTYNMTVMEVLTQKYQFAKPTYKYTPTALVKQAVSDVFDKGVRLTEEKLLYFYAIYVVNPNSFHETQRCLVETKIHRYFGPW